jgi:glycosyltransferase involved in cell wall biosynthesis
VNHPDPVPDPLVSVILAVYNREGSVARAIASVLEQTYRQLELIVVDDGSTDGTRAVVESFGAPVTLITQAHAGVYPARNRGLRHARGELVAFIDSDDAWLSDKLEAQVPLMRRREVGLVFGDAVHVTAPKEGAPRTGLTSFRVASLQPVQSWCAAPAWRRPAASRRRARFRRTISRGSASLCAIIWITSTGR